MDEISVNDQYYIATESSPADDRTRVLKHGRMFAVLDRHGDIESYGLKEQGIFYEGTRHLSKFELYLGRARPLLLSSTVKSDNSLFTADLANLDISSDGKVVVPRGTVHVARSEFLWQGACYKQFEILNYGLCPVDIPFRIRFAADFADIFEVRGIHRALRGRRLPTRVEHDSITLSYEGLDGLIRSTLIRCSPSPKSISDSEIQFDASLEPRTHTTFTVIVSCISYEHSNGNVRTFAAASAAAAEELNESLHDSCSVSSSNEELNDWLERSQADVRMMIVGNPERDYPYAGVPWFSTVFGRDGIITALECLWTAPSIARGVLEFLAYTQATTIDPRSEAEPGKILHEMRRGEMAALREIPFAFYFGTIDATPLFLMLADAYYQRTGDRELIQKIWPNILLALEWIDRYGDCDSDGFVEYSRHTSEGLVHQGWKDSNDSVFHADGTLAEGPIALCEVQGYVYAAKRGVAGLAAMMGDTDRAGRLLSESANLRARFHKAFWMDELQMYAIALDGNKRPCRIRTSNAGQCLYTGISDPEPARLVADQLVNSRFFSGWGIRTVAAGEARYNPISYHNGSIWPHDNALIAAGLARYGYRPLASRVFDAMLSASGFMELHRLPELFSGFDRRVGEGPTLYPVACSPQAWAAGSVFLLLQSCLGLSLHAGLGQVHFERPYLPETVPHLVIRNLKLADASLDLSLERRSGSVRIEILEKRGNVQVVVS